MTASRRLGLFFCHSPHLQERRFDAEHLKKVAAEFPAIEAVLDTEALWSPAFFEQLEKTLADQKLDGLLLVSDLLTPSPPALSRHLQAGPLAPEQVEVLAWETLPELLHLPPEEATKRAEMVLRQTIHRLLAEEPLQFEELAVSRTVLVLGQGLSALKAAAELAEAGLEVVLASAAPDLGSAPGFLTYEAELAAAAEELAAQVRNHSRIEVRLHSRLTEFHGTPGRYLALLAEAGEKPREYLVGGVVVASEPELRLDLNAWGLGPHARLWSLTDFVAHLGGGKLAENFTPAPEGIPNPVVFLLGFTHPSQPVFHRLAYQAALQLLEEYNWPSLILLDHLKVADQGLEALAYKVRDAGVVFAKLTGRRPQVEAKGDSLTVRFLDEVMGQEVEIRPHLVVLEEKAGPSAELRELAGILEVFPDPEGFLQGDHIYNLPIYTNRTGILAVGPARGSLSPAENLAEAQEAALQLSELLKPERLRVALNRVKLDRRKCAICLTCYRLCPHRAISVVNRRPQFSDLACRICGICASECPMDALQVHHYSDSRYENELRVLASAPALALDPERPRIVVFACRNSALQAARLAAARRLDLPRGLEILEVSCAGKVDPDYVLRAFREGADGVLVLACHPESCQSFHGSPRARERVQALRDFLAETGLEAERLAFATLAPGTSQEFVRLTREMSARITALGPNPLRQPLGETA